jgi:hypothetical protein
VDRVTKYFAKKRRNSADQIEEIFHLSRNDEQIYDFQYISLSNISLYLTLAAPQVYVNIPHVEIF